jgi:dTDP-4-amino-4,6-dideoxygalactose transaminase
MIPFSPPRIDDETIEAVTEALRSGWITTGPRTKQFEAELATYLQARKVACMGSWTGGAELVLRWFGIEKGDEVLLPAYTYAASANIICHVGARPVLVDSRPGDFNVDIQEMLQRVTETTKAIIPVDIGGIPALTETIQDSLPRLASTSNEAQEALGRPLVFSDAAHSIGAKIDGMPSGSTADIAGYSFHAVKNLTTAEGGALAFYNESLDMDQVYRWFMKMSLHGQSKDALEKTNVGSWRYDIDEHGYKCNMTDIQAAIGLVELARYENDMLGRRAEICEAYDAAFSQHDWAELRPTPENIKSSNHLYMLRIRDISESQRDDVIDNIMKAGVSVNVHFMPLPMLTAFARMGFKMEDYPNAYDAYSREISLPVYYDLTESQVSEVVDTVVNSVKKILG